MAGSGLVTVDLGGCGTHESEGGNAPGLTATAVGRWGRNWGVGADKAGPGRGEQSEACCRPLRAGLAPGWQSGSMPPNALSPSGDREAKHFPASRECSWRGQVDRSSGISGKTNTCYFLLDSSMSIMNVPVSKEMQIIFIVDFLEIALSF